MRDVNWYRQAQRSMSSFERPRVSGFRGGVYGDNAAHAELACTAA